MASDEQQQMEVVIVVDNFAPEFAPLTYSKPWGFNCFYQFRFVDLCLEWVSWLESPNVIVALANQPEEIASKLREKWASNFKQLQTFCAQKCHSVNDVLREVEARRLLKTDFILIQNCATFCSSNLAKQIDNFKIKRRQNKNNVLTLLYSENSKNVHADGGVAELGTDSRLLAYHAQSHKLVHYGSGIQRENELVRIPKSTFLAETTFRTDLVPCGIALCAHEFSGHFAGNYDFHSFDGIVHDILSNEEFLAQHIHLDIVSDLCAMTVDSYPALFQTHQALLRRQCFPLTFENVLPIFADFDRPKHRSTAGENVYSPELEKLIELDGKSELKDALFGKHCNIESCAKVESSSFGMNAHIGKNAVARSVICGDDVKIGDGVLVEYALIGSDVHIGEAAKVPRGCVLGNGVRLDQGEVLTNGTVLMAQPWVENESKKEAVGERQWQIESEPVKNGHFLWKLCVAGKKTPFWSTNVNNVSTSLANAQIGDSSATAYNKDDLNPENEIIDVTYQANTRAFVSEVVDSMQGILEDLASASEQQQTTSPELIDKMKLEINASKLAYNIPVDEVAKDVFLAFLNLPGVVDKFANFSQMYKNWQGLWKTYYKKSASRVQMLSAIEEFAWDNERFRRIVPNVLHFLNQGEEVLDDTTIVGWYVKLDEQSPLKRLPELDKLIRWLQSAEEDSETSTVETEEDNDEKVENK